VFYLATKADQTKYGAILHDFSYLRNVEVRENRISSDVDLVDLDEEFRETHMELLVRFYRLFESIYKYIKDLTRYLEDVEEGVYIQLRMEVHTLTHTHTPTHTHTLTHTHTHTHPHTHTHTHRTFWPATRASSSWQSRSSSTA
jgi:carbohydrate-binding DOMON domain-containing protein